ncbi:uncharacterized protein V6R79_022060 [Siganus canaliculatus]
MTVSGTELQQRLESPVATSLQSGDIILSVSSRAPADRIDMDDEDGCFTSSFTRKHLTLKRPKMILELEFSIDDTELLYLSKLDGNLMQLSPLIILSMLFVFYFHHIIVISVKCDRFYK